MKKILPLLKLDFLFTLVLIMSAVVIPAPTVGLGFEPMLKLPYPLASHVSQYYNNTIYNFAGATNTVSNKVLSATVQNLQILKWEEISSPVPKSLFWHSMAFENEFVYVLGGSEFPSGNVVSTDAVYLSKIENGKVSNWLPLKPLPKPLSFGFTFIFQNKIYYSGGASWDGSINDYVVRSEIYSAQISSDGSISDWTDAGNLPTKMLGHVVINTGNKFYLISGYDDEQKTSTANIYEGALDTNGKFTWFLQSQGAFPDPTYKAYVFMATIVDNYVIVAGGRGPDIHSNNGYDDVFFSQIQEDGSLGPWLKSIYSLPGPTCCAGVATDGSSVFLTGGFNLSTYGYLDTVWYASVSDITASPTTPTPTLTPVPPTPTPIPTIVPTSTPIPTPTTEPINRPLLVFVPGMGASWNSWAILHDAEIKNEDWQIPDYIDTYNEFFATLESVGYKKGVDMWIYPYDWRDSVMTNGARLKQFIQNKVLSGKPEGTKVVLVAHSMGGLVARAATDEQFSSKVDKIITFGTPHAGSAMSYPVWEGADFSDFADWQSAILRGYVKINSVYYENELLTIHVLIPSVQNLLPARNHIKYANDNEVDWNRMVWKNNVYSELSRRLSFQANKLYSFAGTDENTIKGYVVKKQGIANVTPGYWLDGKPIGKINSYEGDNTVIVSDALISSGVETYTFEETDHGEIISKKESQNKLLEILGLSATDRIDNSKYKLYNKSLVIMLGSPAYFNLVTPDGEIINSDDNLLLVDEPKDGEYKIQLTTTGEGEYSLYFGRLNGGDEAWEEFHGYSSGAGKTHIFVYQVQMNQPNLGAEPENNIKAKISSLLGKLQQTQTLKPIRPMVSAHLRNILRLLEHANKFKQGWVKQMLVKKIEVYLGNVIDLVENAQTKQPDKEIYNEVIWDLRRIMQDLKQYEGDIWSLPN